MENYKKPNPDLWTGRPSGNALYLHEKVKCLDLAEDKAWLLTNTFALLGYACDEGVKRNQGRAGAAQGPGAIRTALAKMANHLDKKTALADVGDITCEHHNLEAAQETLAGTVAALLQRRAFPVLLGGGHDIALGHYRGIKQYLSSNAKKNIGIINFDAHFDLRTTTGQGNSGTPFYQIAQECEANEFHYLCLGIQRQANIRTLFDTAEKLGVKYISNEAFSLRNLDTILNIVQTFIDQADHIYLTIDLDGFSSAIAPGVSAPSPAGFSWHVAMETVKSICRSGKLISADIAEMNPAFDVDDHTAKLAAGLVVGLMGCWMPDT